MAFGATGQNTHGPTVAFPQGFFQREHLLSLVGQHLLSLQATLQALPDLQQAPPGVLAQQEEEPVVWQLQRARAEARARMVFMGVVFLVFWKRP